MNAHDVATVFAIALAVGLPVSIAGAVVPSLRSRAQPLWLPLIAVVAVGATLGSLYFSERAGFVPCELCWYQRIAMYPLALIGTMAAIRRDRSVLPYVLSLASVGFVVSAYHVYIQAFPEESNFCEIANPCSAKWVQAFGWVSIPQMAGASFAMIAASSVALILDGRGADERGAGEHGDVVIDDGDLASID